MRRETIGRPMEILLVEDTLTSARLTMAALKKGPVQHRLTWLGDGAEALEFLHQRGKYAQAPRPDLILLDLEMPRVDGRQVLKDIKADPQLEPIPVVILTASTDEEDLRRTEELHVTRYLTKPVDLDEFLRLVTDLRDYWRADMVLPGALGERDT